MSLETSPIDGSNKTEKLTFHDACAEGNYNVVGHYVTQHGFDMYTVDNSERTGFHLACFYGNLNVVQFLLEEGFDMYVGDKDRRTGFHLACFMGNLNVVQFLLQEGFDINFRFSLGRTGFHVACFMGNLNVVQFLLEKGFDMNVCAFHGGTGFHAACIGGKANSFMIKLGFSLLDISEYNESTSFPVVRCHGNLNVVQFLLQQGFDMNTRDANGATGFHYACLGGNSKVVQFFLQQGFDMNTGDEYGGTGFIVACMAGNFNIISFLLHHEFKNINEFSFQRTGLDILIEERSNYLNDELYMPCVLLLIEAGGKVSEEHVFEELISTVQNRIIEITFMKTTIDKKWTERIAQLVTDFTMEPFTNISLQNLSQFLGPAPQPTRPTSTLCSFY